MLAKDYVHSHFQHSSHLQRRRLHQVRTQLHKEGAEHGLGIDETMLPGIVFPTAVAPPEAAEETALWILVSEFRIENVFHYAKLGVGTTGRKGTSRKTQPVHTDPI